MYSKNELIDNDVKSLRTKENLNFWEIYMTKYPNLPYNKGAAKFIKSLIERFGAVRLILKDSDAQTNERRAYHFAKHLINSGISPSNICITNIEDCYLSIRGFGDNAAIKDKIFRNENQLIIIENMREMRMTDVKDNVYSFWQEFWAYCRKHRNLNVLLCFDTVIESSEMIEVKDSKGEVSKKKIDKIADIKDWYPRETNKAPHKELHFTYLNFSKKENK